jgi:hypothetical protein
MASLAVKAIVTARPNAATTTTAKRPEILFARGMPSWPNLLEMYSNLKTYLLVYRHRRRRIYRSIPLISFRQINCRCGSHPGVIISRLLKIDTGLADVSA